MPAASRTEGACCFTDGSCLIATADDCLTQGGAYQGDATLCDPNPCPQPPAPVGACCFTDGSCLIATGDDCLTQGGSYQGDATLCDPNPCPQPPAPEGACCFTDGSCLIATGDDCLTQGGSYQGDATLCDPNPCPQPVQPGACGQGFWKNHEEAWVPTGYAPDDLVGGVFTIPAGLSDLDDDTLEEALGYPGGSGAMGGARLLLRTAVTALLNAGHPDVHYTLTIAEIIDAVNPALASMDKQVMQDARHAIDNHNDCGCPLGND